MKEVNSFDIVVYLGTTLQHCLCKRCWHSIICAKSWAKQTYLQM